MPIEAVLVYKEKVSNRARIEREKDLYRYLRRHVFDEAIKIYSFVVKGIPDFIVISTKREELKPGFYEVKFSKKLESLTENQEVILDKLSKGFKVYVVLYDMKERELLFYEIMKKTLDKISL